MPFWVEAPRAEARWPSWKTNVTMPVAAAAVSALVSRAITGSVTDPVISHKTSRVSAASSGSATGRVRTTAACWSARLAACPPTATGNRAGWVRAAATRDWADAEAAAPRTPTLICQVPWPRSAGGVTLSTPPRPLSSLA